MMIVKSPPIFLPICATVSLFFASNVIAVDTDRDGLLDLVDSLRFNPDAIGIASFANAHIEDLDGANQLSHAQELNLANNLITSIEAGDFQDLSELQSLSLWNNQITRIENGSFHGLASLQTLGLGQNRIASIEKGDFDGLENLQRLTMGSNQIAEIEEEGLHGLTNLRWLSLDNNEISSFESFGGLTNLEGLDLNDNRITEMERGDFVGLTSLHTLALNGNQISRFESRDFDELTELRSLDLGSNQIARIDAIDFASLTNLQSLDLSENKIESVTSGVFQHLTNLETLRFGGNQISSLERGVFNGLPSLRFLGLSSNPITDIENGAFKGLPNLEQLYIYNDTLTHLNFSQAEFSELHPCREDLEVGFADILAGFCSRHDAITSLSLDDATLSGISFAAIQSAVQWSATDVSLVGLRLTDESPTLAEFAGQNVPQLLSSGTRRNITVDQALYDSYREDFKEFADLGGNTLEVIGYGDSNRDGRFDSRDFVQVFTSGEYHDDIEGNSYWTEGDWNSDGDFDSADLVIAFAAGRYQQASRFSAVPEPFHLNSLSAVLAFAALCKAWHNRILVDSHRVL